MYMSTCACMTGVTIRNQKINSKPRDVVDDPVALTLVLS